MECASATGSCPAASIGVTILSIRASRSASYSAKSSIWALSGVVRHQPARTALAAPVQRRHGKAAAAQFVDHFKIFLDEFGLAVEQHADAAAAGRIGREIAPRASCAPAAKSATGSKHSRAGIMGAI